MLTPAFMFRQTCAIEAWQGRGVSADAYAGAVEVRCRANFGRKLVSSRQPGQQEVTAAGTFYLPADAAVAVKDRLTFDGAKYSVIACRKRFNPDGSVNHIEVDVQ